MQAQAAEARTRTAQTASGGPRYDTLPGLLLHCTGAYRDLRALAYPSRERWLTLSYGELRERCVALALGLADLGIRSGESVGLIAPSSPFWPVVDFAIQIAGGVTVPIFKRISVESFTHEVRDSGMRYLFVGNPEEIPVAFSHAGPGVKLITFWYSGVHRMFDELLERGRRLAAQDPGLFARLAGRAREEDLATIIYTSGSTGLPKGVELTQRNLVTQVRGCEGLFDLRPGDLCLSTLPLEHVFERMVLYLYLSKGLSVHFVDDPKRLGDFLRSVRPVIVTVVPRILEKLAARIEEKAAAERGPAGLLARAALRRAERRGAGRRRLVDPIYRALVYPKILRALGGRLRYVISGASRLSPRVARLLVGIGVPVYEGYGLTEASPVIAVNRRGARKIGAVGRLFPGVEVRIADDGEILARGPNVMRGYHNEPRATAAVLDGDGWLHTGDLGSFDSDGFLRIEGRKKELLKKSTGEYVPRGPIEAKLSAIPWVDLAVIIADSRPYVVALLFPDPQKLDRCKAEAGLADLPDAEFLRSEYLRETTSREIEAINEHLHHCERVEGFSIMSRAATVEGGELTPTLKPRRFFIEGKESALIEEMYRSIGGWK